MTNSVDIRAHIVNVFRRDLIGPGPQDADLASERLNESPARWYLAGFIAPAEYALALVGDDDEMPLAPAAPRLTTRSLKPPTRVGAFCRRPLD